MSAWKSTEPARSAEEPRAKPRQAAPLASLPLAKPESRGSCHTPLLCCFCSRNTTRRSSRSPVFRHATAAMIAQSRRDPAACFTCFIRSRSGASPHFKNDFVPFMNADGRESTMRLRQSHGCTLQESGAVTRCRERSAKSAAHFPGLLSVRWALSITRPRDGPSQRRHLCDPRLPQCLRAPLYIIRPARQTVEHAGPWRGPVLPAATASRLTTTASSTSPMASNNRIQMFTAEGDFLRIEKVNRGYHKRSRQTTSLL